MSPLGPSPPIRRRRDAPAPRDPEGLAVVLARATGRLRARLDTLESQLDAADGAAWPLYLATLDTLVRVVAQSAPGGRGELLTTKQMAERLGIAPKTLLKHTTSGAIRPVVRRGKLIRWAGSEALR